jgi:hypothetical protein
MFSRPLVVSDGITRPGRPGDGCYANFAAQAVSADAATTWTINNIAGGLIIRTGLTAGRTDTTPTGALIDAANPLMDVGDNFIVVVSNRAAQVLTIAGGTGVTVSGFTTLNAATRWAIFTKTGVATYTCDLV